MKSNIYRISEAHSAPKVTGKGQKGLLIVLHEADKAENNATLEGLVKAIKHDIEEDVTIVSCIDTFTSINSILKSQPYTTVILIGVVPDQIGFSIEAKKYFYYKMEGFSLLLTDSLQAMNADKAKKMKFWQNLQERFLA